VARYGQYIGDWKTLCDQVKKQLDEALERERQGAVLAAEAMQGIDAVAAQVNAVAFAKSTTATSAPAAVKGVNPREVESLRKLCIAMAVAGYNYDPLAARSPVVAEIVDDIWVWALSWMPTLSGST
jgi:hypothetical protein